MMISQQENGNMVQSPYYHNPSTQNDWVSEHAPLSGVFAVDYEFLRSHVAEYPKTFAHYVSIIMTFMEQF
jgi:hypothetical protein